MVKEYAIVAQLDRVAGYEPVGRGFESLLSHQAKDFGVSGVFFCIQKYNDLPS